MATFGRLSITTSIPIVLVSALAFWFTISIGLAHLERTLAAVQESRMRFTAGQLRASLQSGIDLDLAFAGAGKAQRILDAAVRADPGIAAAGVLDPAGTVVFSSGTLARNARYLTLSAPLVNDRGTRAGTIVLHYAATPQAGALRAAVRELALGAAVSVAAIGVCCLFGFRSLLRQNQRRFNAMTSRLGAGRTQAGHDPDIALVEQVTLTAKAALHEVNSARDYLSCREPMR